MNDSNRELLQDIDKIYHTNTKFKVYFGDTLEPKLKYTTNVNDGKFHRTLNTNTENIDSQEEEIDVEDETTPVMDQTKGMSLLTDEFIVPERSLYTTSLINTIPYVSLNLDDIGVRFSPENRCLIVDSYAQIVARDTGNRTLERFLSYQETVKQVQIYQKSAPKKMGTLGKIASKFKGLIYIPSHIGEVSVYHDNDSSLNELAYYEDHSYNQFADNMGVIAPVLIVEHKDNYNEHKQETRFTKIYSRVDIVNRIDMALGTDNKLEPNQRKQLLRNTNFLVEYLMLHYNRSWLNSDGYVQIVNGETITSYLPKCENFNLDEALTEDKERGYSASILEVEYLKYLAAKSNASIESERILKSIKEIEIC